MTKTYFAAMTQVVLLGIVMFVVIIVFARFFPSARQSTYLGTSVEIQRAIDSCSAQGKLPVVAHADSVYCADWPSGR